MSGLYVHIPFCKQACHYCNFHFSTSLQRKEAMVTALVQEMTLRRDYLGGQTLSSIYFGGGTPSLLDTDELVYLFDTIHRLFSVQPDAEITLEANPDDLSAEKTADLRAYTPVNRLSIGIQSFQEADLRWMNRAHNVAEARQCIENARKTGFDQLTIDLIYGAPVTDDAAWADNVAILLDYQVPHFSAYCLTVETGTALAHFVQKGKASPVDDEKAVRQLQYLIHHTAAAGYEQYEISNFAQAGCHARHNTNYWRGAPYLGIGPSAHSFDGHHTRHWNEAHNAHYLSALEQGQLPPADSEQLTPENRYNEYVMTNLRTMWGCDLSAIQAIGPDFVPFFEKNARPFLHSGSLTRSGDVFCLTPDGKLMADGIAAAFFKV